MNKGLKWALISLPILIGGFIVYKTLRPQKPKQDTPPPIPLGGGGTPTSGGGGYTPPPPPPKAAFPMGLGSKGAKVKELQQAIISSGDATAIGFLGRAGADGSFGTGTEKAVKQLLGKTKVDSQADIDKIKNYKVNAQLMEQGENNRITFGKSILEKMPTNLTTLANGNFITKTTFDSTKQREVNKETFTYKKGEIARPWGYRPLVQQKFVADKNTPILQTGTVVMWVTEGGKNVRYHFNPYFFAKV